MASDNSEEKRSGVAIEFRIMTFDMHRMNEWGALAEFHLWPDRYGTVSAWWNWVGSRQIDLIRQNDLETETEHVYCYTPGGRLVELRNGATALDFSYRVHSELGSETARVEVNGEPVALSHSLNNGDVVRVLTAPHATGPDLAWLSIAVSPTARVLIRRALINRARAAHPGRVAILEEWLRAVRYFETKRGFKLTVSTARLDSFLHEMALLLHLPSLQALYVEVCEGRVTPRWLVMRLLALELAPSLVDEYGEPLRHATTQITYCDACRPVPGDRVVAARLRNGGIQLHIWGNPKCNAGSQPHQHREVFWTRKPPTNTVVAELQVTAEDRRGILEEILQPIYDDRTANPLEVYAQTRPDSTAVIRIVVEATDMGLLARIEAAVHAVPGVLQVWLVPTSELRRMGMASQTPLGLQRENPYNEADVAHRLNFVNRVAEIARMKEWLSGGGHACLMLHGMKRVGKTALAKYYINYVLPDSPVAVAIYLDMHEFSRFSMDQIAHRLYHLIAAAVSGLKLPAPAPREQPVVWFRRVLAEAIRLLGTRKLLIVLDEFGHLLDAVERGEAPRTLLANLSFLLTLDLSVRWMLIVPENQWDMFGKWPEISRLYQHSDIIELAPLDALASRNLIEGPMRRSNLQPEKGLSDRIFQLAAGNPYLTNQICLHLVSRVTRQNRSPVRLEDLTAVETGMAEDGDRYFAHVREVLRPTDCLVLGVAARSCVTGADVQLSTLGRALRRLTPPIGMDECENSLMNLDRLGVIRLDPARQRVSIPSLLLCKWAKNRFAPPSPRRKRDLEVNRP